MTVEAIMLLAAATLLLGGGLVASIINIARQPEKQNFPTDVPPPAE